MWAATQQNLLFIPGASQCWGTGRPPPHPPRLMASLVTQSLLLQAPQGE